MSSYTGGPQLSQAAANDIPRLPPELWAEIFRRLDLESLINVAEAVPECECLALSPTVLKRVNFDMETDEHIISKFLRTTREEDDHDGHTENVPLSSHVRELCFNNGRAIHCNVILNCAEQCRNLRELCCVNCLVHPAELFNLLSVTLKRVTKLEWTLYEESCYPRGLDHVTLQQIETRAASEGPKILAMYVELDRTTVTERILDSFLMRCPRLGHLHIHDIRQPHLPVISTDACLADFTPDKAGTLNIIERIPSLQTLKYTYETPLNTKREERISELRNNIAWQRKPVPSFNVAGLSDVVKHKASVRSMEQVMVTVKANSGAPALLKQAAAKPELWKDASRLTLVLMPDAKSDNLTPPTVHRVLVKPLGEFFKTCLSQLTELNLSTCHFKSGCVCCSVVASTLTKLHALTLPPCGANLKCSLEHLAHGCKLLVRLEVRSIDTVAPAAPCEECKRPLPFTASCFDLLHRETRLNELSIDETAEISNLSFLIGCRVQKLRLRLGTAWCAGPLLAGNTRLSSLTVVVNDAEVCGNLPRTLAAVRSLRHLCVIATGFCVCRVYKVFLCFLGRHMPQLRTAHLHNRVMWGHPAFMVTFKPVSQWRPDYGRKARVDQRKTDFGVVRRHCSADSFVGLVRPRSRF
ncbi:hypothetical protein HPB50_005705 [Hyalomma asiaticum]|uniref:Uncharacterized protein n=1 Tax=Hyalomma asiaticum TaxID=266040 RepID=A0ACB7RS01_HYAAI|nr:hypothetical protein HPB50_005705 [Hyalomma asiaticum]